MNEGEFEGRVALVTGGSLGIGRAVVERLAAAGASVILCGADEDSVHASEDDLRAAGLKVTGIRADVTVAAEAQGLVTCAVKYYGGLDIVVNSAGIQRYGTVEETSEAEWDRVLDVNLKGIFLVCRAAIPELRRRGGGAVVNVASVQATATQAGVAAYTASKRGILALTPAMAVDHAVDGIRVTVVSPDRSIRRCSAGRPTSSAASEAPMIWWPSGAVVTHLAGSPPPRKSPSSSPSWPARGRPSSPGPNTGSTADCSPASPWPSRSGRSRRDSGGVRSSVLLGRSAAGIDHGAERCMHGTRGDGLSSARHRTNHLAE
jgi:NAD(P)-dependent dehydrogenase (short-subunit alcohol dehydrogenase family)